MNVCFYTQRVIQKSAFFFFSFFSFSCKIGNRGFFFFFFFFKSFFQDLVHHAVVFTPNNANLYINFILVDLTYFILIDLTNFK
jgi:hypothetical protein